jgi:hypothetical protein
MDGATNKNPSNAPPLTAREEKKVERSIAKEATAAEKHVSQVGKALKAAQKDEGKAEKVCPAIHCKAVGHNFFSVYINEVEQETQKAQRAREKAIKQEHLTAQALSDAQHKHDLAVADENKAANDLSVGIVVVLPLISLHLPIVTRRLAVSPLLQMCQKHLQEAHQTVESRRAELVQAQRRKDSGDVRTVYKPPV